MGIGTLFDRDCIIYYAIFGVIFHPSEVHGIDLITRFAERSFYTIFEFSHHLLAIGLFNPIILNFTDHSGDMLLKCRVEEYRATKPAYVGP